MLSTSPPENWEQPGLTHWAAARTSVGTVVQLRRCGRRPDEKERRWPGWPVEGSPAALVRASLRWDATEEPRTDNRWVPRTASSHFASRVPARRREQTADHASSLPGFEGAASSGSLHFPLRRMLEAQGRAGQLGAETRRRRDAPRPRRALRHGDPGVDQPAPPGCLLLLPDSPQLSNWEAASGPGSAGRGCLKQRCGAGRPSSLESD